MADIETTTVSDEGYTTRSSIDQFDLVVDAANDEGPTPNQALVADYAACYLAALRAGGRQADHEHLGRIEIDAAAETDDDLESISFDVRLEEELSEDVAGEILSNADDLCHVRAALREELRADVEIHAGEA